MIDALRVNANNYMDDPMDITWPDVQHVVINATWRRVSEWCFDMLIIKRLLKDF